jgi:hypothetical protein
MADDFAPVFSVLKDVLARHERRLAVSANSPTEYTVLTRTPSPFPQHKGNPMYFGSVRLGKAYVSFHLMPLYMCPKLTGLISAGLKKRMQGKTCFNFKAGPEPQLLRELESLTVAGLNEWVERKWL